MRARRTRRLLGAARRWRAPRRETSKRQPAGRNLEAGAAAEGSCRDKCRAVPYQTRRVHAQTTIYIAWLNSLRSYRCQSRGRFEEAPNSAAQLCKSHGKATASNGTSLPASKNRTHACVLRIASGLLGQNITSPPCSCPFLSNSNATTGLPPNTFGSSSRPSIPTMSLGMRSSLRSVVLRSYLPAAESPLDLAAASLSAAAPERVSLSTSSRACAIRSGLKSLLALCIAGDPCFWSWIHWMSKFDRVTSARYKTRNITENRESSRIAQLQISRDA